MKDFQKVAEALVSKRGRSSWERGVIEYAGILVEKNIENYGSFKDFTNPKMLEKELLSGAKSWRDYSWGGSGIFCYNGDIAKNLCTPSEFKKSKEGTLPPNSSEQWLDVQARALFQASNLIIEIFESLEDENINFYDIFEEDDDDEDDDDEEDDEIDSETAELISDMFQMLEAGASAEKIKECFDDDILQYAFPDLYSEMSKC